MASAWDGERLVGAGVVYIRGELAWLGAAGTLPHERGRGAQSGILAARIRADAHAGARMLAIETVASVDGESEASFRNVVRAGFKEAFRQEWWVSPHEGEFTTR